MIDIKIIPQAGGDKGYVELFHEAMRLIREENNVIAAGYFICTDEDDFNDFTGSSRALKAAAVTLSQDIDRSMQGD